MGRGVVSRADSINQGEQMTSLDEHTLEVGTNGNGEVVINHSDLYPDENGVGHIVFSVAQAQHLASILQKKAGDAAQELQTLRMAQAESIPVDRSCQVLVNGNAVPEDRSHTEIRSNGQQADYVVLCDSERRKGFVRPYRDTYKHLTCGKVTTMSRAIAETYARDPGFYGGTFCFTCGAHFPIGESGEFVWCDLNGSIGPKVGT
jgi:hypothetical protein